MKSKKTISLIVGLICVAITAFGIFHATNMSFFKLPVMVVLGADAVADAEDQFEEYADELDEASDEEIEEFEDETGISYKEVKAFYKTPSINRVVSLGEKLDEYIDEETLSVCKLFRNIIIGYGLFVALFSLLGALLHKKVFPILAMIFSLLFYAAFVGVLFLALFLAASIVHTVLISKAQKAAAAEAAAAAAASYAYGNPYNNTPQGY